MDNTSILSPKYQIVIPKDIRRQLHLRPGQQIEFTINGDHIELRPIPRPEELIGFLKEETPLQFDREADRKID